MTTKYHTRQGYEQLFHNLCKETHLPIIKVHKLSDFQLLSAINLILTSFGCIPLDIDELETDLK